MYRTAARIRSSTGLRTSLGTPTCPVSLRMTQIAQAKIAVSDGTASLDILQATGNQGPQLARRGTRTVTWQGDIMASKGYAADSGAVPEGKPGSRRMSGRLDTGPERYRTTLRHRGQHLHLKVPPVPGNPGCIPKTKVGFPAWHAVECCLHRLRNQNRPVNTSGTNKYTDRLQNHRDVGTSTGTVGTSHISQPCKKRTNLNSRRRK